LYLFDQLGGFLIRSKSDEGIPEENGRERRQITGMVTKKKEED